MPGNGSSAAKSCTRFQRVPERTAGGRGADRQGEPAQRRPLAFEQFRSRPPAAYTTGIPPRPQTVKPVATAVSTGFGTAKEGEYAVGMVVQHEQYGIGQVSDVSGFGALKKLKIRFPAAGEKTFVADKVKLKIAGKKGTPMTPFLLTLSFTVAAPTGPKHTRSVFVRAKADRLPVDPHPVRRLHESRDAPGLRRRSVGPADHAKNDMIVKRSDDGEDVVRVIADFSDVSLEATHAVVERTTGRVLLMFQSFPANLAKHGEDLVPGVTGGKYRQTYARTSDDDGKTSWKTEGRRRRATLATTVATARRGEFDCGTGITRAGSSCRSTKGRYGIWNIYCAFSDDSGEAWKMTTPQAG